MDFTVAFWKFLSPTPTLSPVDLDSHWVSLSSSLSVLFSFECCWSWSSWALWSGAHWMSRDVGKTSHNLSWCESFEASWKKFLHIYPSFWPRRMFSRGFYFSTKNTRVEFLSRNIYTAYSKLFGLLAWQILHCFLLPYDFACVSVCVCVFMDAYANLYLCGYFVRPVKDIWFCVVIL